MFILFRVVLIFTLIGIFVFRVEADPKITSQHPAVCEAINPAQSQRMQWRERGLTNTGSTPLWVMCPLITEIDLSRSDPYNTYNLHAIVLRNDSFSVMEIECAFRFFSYSQDNWVNKPLEKVALSSGISDSIIFEHDYDAPQSASIACKLPNNGVIEGLASAIIPN